MLDLARIFGTLHRSQVAFVAIGGVAVGAHGYIRMTMDIDIVPDPASANIERLVSALSQLQATVPSDGGRPFDPPVDAAALRRGANATLDTPFGGVDVVQRLAGVPPYPELAAAAEHTELDGRPLLICSLAHLRAMKAAAGRPQDRADLAALPDRDAAG